MIYLITKRYPLLQTKYVGLILYYSEHIPLARPCPPPPHLRRPSVVIFILISLVLFFLIYVVVFLLLYVVFFLVYVVVFILLFLVLLHRSLFHRSPSPLPCSSTLAC
ncbi:hypothetical protein F4819DRAFT_340093 [Hypoxylon fuscum]|nr:hypothetical protein F4819DRAFT_340093 [Hypoxylon fuscum]